MYHNCLDIWTEFEVVLNKSYKKKLFKGEKKLYGLYIG